MAKEFWETDEKVSSSSGDEFWKGDEPAAKQALPADVKPSAGGAGRGSVNPPILAARRVATPAGGVNPKQMPLTEADPVTDPMGSDLPSAIANSGRPSVDTRSVLERTLEDAPYSRDQLAGQQRRAKWEALQPENYAQRQGARYMQADPIRETPKRGALRTAADVGLGVYQGAAGMIEGAARMVPIVGAPVAEFLDTASKGADRLKSPELHEQTAVRQGRIESVKNRQGEVAAARAAFQSVFDLPAAGLDVAAQGMGSLVPTLALGSAGVSPHAIEVINALSTAGDAKKSTEEKLRQIDPSAWRKDSTYQTLRSAGLDHEQALGIVVPIYSVPAQVAGGIAGAISAKLGVEQTFANRAAGTVRRDTFSDRIARMGAEHLGEQGETILPGLAQNAVVGGVDDKTGLTEGLGQQITDTAVGTLGPGALAVRSRSGAPGAIAGVPNAHALNSPDAAPAKPATLLPAAASPAAALPSRLSPVVAVEPSPGPLTRAAATAGELSMGGIAGARDLSARPNSLVEQNTAMTEIARIEAQQDAQREMTAAMAADAPAVNTHATSTLKGISDETVKAGASESDRADAVISPERVEQANSRDGNSQGRVAAQPTAEIVPGLAPVVATDTAGAAGLTDGNPAPARLADRSGESEAASNSAAPADGGRKAGTPATYESVEAAANFVRQQRARGTRISALPHTDTAGTVTLAMKGTPEYQQAIDQREQRVKAKAREDAGIREGDILTRSGNAFKAKVAAINAQKAAGPGHAIVPVQGGFVVRKEAIDAGAAHEISGVASAAARAGRNHAPGGVAVELGGSSASARAAVSGASVATGEQSSVLSPAGRSDAPLKRRVGAAVPLSAPTVTDSGGKTYPTKGEPLPKTGVAPANLGSNGTVYVGRRNGQHFELANAFPKSERGDFKSTGFVNADGHYMDREQALAWVEKNEKPVSPAENMEGSLDALDYREQVPDVQRVGKGGKKAVAPREKKADKVQRERDEARAKYFTPGNVVRSYGGFDRVVSYQSEKTGADAGAHWSVTVQPVKQVSPGKFEDVSSEGPRTHGTQPDARDLKGGPVGRVPAEGEGRGSTVAAARVGVEAPMFSRSSPASSKEKTGREIASDVQKARVLQGEPVAVLAGDQAPHGYSLLRAWATKLFSAVGGKARNAEIGEVMLDERSVRDSMAHRMNPFKAEAFAAVPQVIEKGVVISSAAQQNQDSFYISAPVRIRGVDDLVTVLVRRNPETQRMYLHSVATKEYLLTRFKSRTDAEASEHTGGAESGDTPAIVLSEARFGKLQGDEVGRELNRLLTLKLDAGDGRDGARTDRPVFSRSAGYGDAVDAAVQAGIKGEAPGRQPVAVGSVAPTLRAAGIPDGALRISPTILSKAVFDHGVTKSVLKRLPEMLHSPVMVFDSDTVQGSFVVVTSEMVNGKPLLVVVSPQESTGGKTFSFVPSLYPKEDISAIQRWLASGKLRYLDTKQSPQWFGSTRLQLPGEFRTAKGLQGRNVATQAAEVKPVPGGHDAPAFSRSAETRGAFEARIDALFAGGKATTGTRILDSSDVMGLLGYPKVPMMLNESHLRESMTTHPEMTEAVWKKVPEWLDSPAAVYRDGARSERLIVIAPQTIAGYPVMLVVEPNPTPARRGHSEPFQLLVTAYAKTTGGLPAPGYLATSGQLLYVDTKNAPEVWQRAGGQFPGQAALRGRQKILTEKQLGGYRRANGAAFSLGDGAGMSVAEVRRTVDGVRSAWANGPEVVVVQNMQDPAVPAAVRQHNEGQRAQGAEGEPEGFFYAGKVYLLADQLGSQQEVARVLFHEALGHYGLRGVFGAELTPILKQLAGLRRADVEAKAKAYGLDVANEQERLMAAEEVLAEMAEKSPSIGFVKRAIAAVRTWLRANVPGFGKLELSDEEIVRNYLLPARGFVERGGQGTGLPGEMRFSRSGDSTSAFAQEVDRAAAAGVADDQQALREQVSLGIETPRALEMLGVARKPVFTTRNLIAKMHLDHGVPRSALKSLPELLADPVLIFASDTQPGRMVVVTSLVVQGNPVVVAVDPNGKSGRTEVVFLPSAYPKDNADRQFSAWTRNGLLKYVNKVKSRQLATTARLQLPGVVQRAIGFRPNYKTDADLLPAAGNGTPAFSRGESALRELSKADDLFALPKSEKTTVEGIAKDNDSGITVKKLAPFAGRTDYQLTTPDGSYARVFVREPNPYGPSVYDSTRVDGQDQALATERPGENPEDVPPTGDVWIDVSLLTQGAPKDFGAKVYNIAATYAHNTGRIFIGDPNGLSKTALRRRLEHMISSALKFGTTVHLAPHPDQVRGGHGVPGLRWVYGDHVGNVERMIDASVRAMDNAFPGSKLIQYDPDSGTFRRQDNGARLGRGQLAVGLRQSLDERRGVVQSGIAEGEAGWRTVARTALFRSLARRESAGTGSADGRSNGLLEQLLQHAPRAGDEQVDRRIFYSRSTIRSNSGTAAAQAGAPGDQRGDARADGAAAGLTTAQAAKPNPALARAVFGGTMEWTRDQNGKPVKVSTQAEKYNAIDADERGQMLLRKGYITADQLKRWKESKLDIFEGAVNNRFRRHFESPGIVWKDAELREIFKLDDAAIAAYRDLRVTADTSIARHALADMLRLAGEDGHAVRERVMGEPLELASETLRDHLLALATANPERNKALTDRANRVIEIADQANDRMAGGFVPDDMKADARPSGWESSAPGWSDRIIYELQDGKVDLKRTQEAIERAGNAIDQRFDARLAETLYSGRVAKRSQAFLDVEATPLLRMMARMGIGQDELGDYLHARGAPERNAQIAKINPDMPDGGAGKNSKGLLLTNDAARKYVADIPVERRAQLEQLAAKVDAITAGTRQLLVAEGLEKAETIAAWEKAYKNYVPMFREDVEFSRLTVNKRATGSEKKAVNILSHVLMQREAAITRAEKNRVNVALYGLALTNPNPDFWVTIRPGAAAETIQQDLQRMGVDPLVAEAGMQGVPTIRTVDPATNQVVERLNPMYRQLPGAINVKINGENRVLLLNEKDPRAVRLAAAMKGQDQLTELDISGSIIGRTTRWLAAVNTQYNPVFGVVNFLRDTMGGVVNLGSTELRNEKARVMAGLPGALKGIGEHLAGRHDAGRWARLFEQFQMDGGQTGFRELFRDGGERARAIEAQLAKMSKTGKLNPLVVPRMMLSLLDGFNTVTENAVRLSAYAAALDKGMSRPAAARLARELTVDFNRKGRATREVGPLYAFFNAAVQGNERTLRVLRGPTGTKIIAGGLALGVMQALMLAAAGYDDDEIPDFAKARAFIIPLFGKEKKYISIPLPLGLHVLPNTGRVVTEMVIGDHKGMGKKATDALGEILGAFNPLGGGNILTMDGALRTLAPTVVDPFVEIGFNKNFAGNQIERDARGESDSRPGAARARESTQRQFTGQAYLGISTAINTMTGGGEYERGAISPTPERLRYIAQVAGGGVLRELEKVINASAATSLGEKVSSNSVPVASRFYGEVDRDQVSRSRYIEGSKRIEALEGGLKAAKKGGDAETVERLLRANPEAGLIHANNRAQQAIQKLNKQATQVIGDRETLREIDKRRFETMRTLSDAIRDMERSQRAPTLAERLRAEPATSR